MNQINLGGANGISGLVTSVTRSYASPSIQELESSPAHRAGKKAKKREDEDTVTFRSNSTLNVEQHERQSHHLSQILEKQSSIQVTGTHLEVLSEEGDERTIKRADGMQQLLHRDTSLAVNIHTPACESPPAVLYARIANRNVPARFKTPPGR
jgi:hypothetical protein